MDEDDLQHRMGFAFSDRVPTARSLRTLSRELVRRRHDPATLAEARELIDRAAALLADNGEVLPISEDLPGDQAGFIDFMERQMVSGHGNPFAPPSPVLEAGEGRSRGRVTLNEVYQGPPGRVHGGYVCVLLDHAVGTATASVLKPPYYTRSLTVDFLHGVPLNTELELHGWLEELDGRKAWMIGEIRHDGHVLARGRALMVQPKKVDA